MTLEECLMLCHHHATTECTGRRDYRISDTHKEKSNAVDNALRELMKLICIAAMPSDPDTHPSKADVCSRHFRAKMSQGMHLPLKI